MKHDTAGDPITGLKWTRKTTEKIVAELQALGILVSANTVGRLLKKMDFSLRLNHKKISSSGKNKPEDRRNRDRQFEYIRTLRESFSKKGSPAISVDAKKRELIGNFKNPGTSWEQESILVNDHDFRSQAVGVGLSYGIYDTQANKGCVVVGTTYDTPAFAVDAIVKWWCEQGCKRYPETKELLILADSGGSNSARARAWKLALQQALCNQYGISVTVCHYPPGASKWNPIEHRLFSEITKNWRGKPLESYETMLNYIRTTKTTTGLKVKAFLAEKNYEKGEKISDDQMSKLQLQSHETFPQWNYTLRPQKCKVIFA